MSRKEEIYTSDAPAEELIPGKTQNLSSTLHQQGDAAMPSSRGGAGNDQRGAPPEFDPSTGDVSGSGSNAGAGGAPGEDYDQDNAGGGTKAPPQAPAR